MLVDGCNLVQLTA